jgi:hypothetical protein
MWNNGTVNIDILRNINTSNRASLTFFKSAMVERILLSLVADNNFRWLLSKYVPYIGYFGKGYDVNMDLDHRTSRISIQMQYPFNLYRRWADENGFNAEGEDPIVVTPTDFVIKQSFKEK